jgi:hypothetical protein
MSLDSYSDLVDAVGDWLDRDDLEARAVDFIRLAEVRLNRILDDPEMEAVVTLTGDGADLPADFGSMISIGTADGYPLSPMSNVEYAAILPSSGVSRYYTIREGKVYYVPGSANPTLVYRRSIPPLTEADDTNWLLERAPDVYLYGALVQAEAFLAEDDRLPLWKGAFDEAIGELRSDGAKRKWGAGPLAPRIRRT